MTAFYGEWSEIGSTIVTFLNALFATSISRTRDEWRVGSTLAPLPEDVT